jgi:hypothetical protein
MLQIVTYFTLFQQQNNMLVSDFNSDFQRYVQDQELEQANNRLLEELAKILVENKKDFIDMLNESGVEADETMPKNQLIELFTQNTDNKKMLLGASLLANTYNKKMSFDGNDEISDENVKLGYAVLYENFNGDEYEEVADEDFSYIVSALGGIVRGGVNLWRNSRQQKGKSTQIGGDDFNRDLERRRDSARRRMEQQAIQRQKVMLEQQRIAQEALERKRKTRNTYIIISVIAVVAIVATIVIVKRKK